MRTSVHSWQCVDFEGKTKRKREKKLYKPVSLQCIVFTGSFSQQLSGYVSKNSPMLWCTDDTLCKLFIFFYFFPSSLHLTALDVTFMWLVQTSGRHLCFETCSINGTTLNYSVYTACFLSFLSRLFLCIFSPPPVHPFGFFFFFVSSLKFLSAIGFHILTTSKKCLTSILVSIFYYFLFYFIFKEII